MGEVQSGPTRRRPAGWYRRLPVEPVSVRAQEMNRGTTAMKTITSVMVCALALTGCSGMTDTQQRALSGTAIGAGGGAILGAIGGNAALGAVAGAGAGLVGGLIYDSVKKNEQASYQQGYSAGRSSASSGH